jgi:hypothetical protein
MRPKSPRDARRYDNGEGSSALSADDSDAAIEQEFDVLMAKAGAEVPTDLKAGVIAGYEDMKRMTALLRQPRTAADEPSNVYSLAGFVRSRPL